MAKLLEGEAQTRQPSSMFDLLALAINNESAIDVIERLGAMQEKAIARDAEIQFTQAMTAVQQEVGRITPDQQAKEGAKQKWATYAKLDKVVRPIYLKNGFSLSFNSGISPTPETVLVECYVSHVGGHTRKYTAPLMPADGKGAKGGDVMTKTFATGAGMSYGARYLLKFIFNIAVGEDDPEAAGVVEQSWLVDQVAEFDRCETLEGLTTAFQAAATVVLEEVKDIKAYHTLKDAKNKRKKELASDNR